MPTFPSLLSLRRHDPLKEAGTRSVSRLTLTLASLLTLAAGILPATAQSGPRFSSATLRTNREVSLRLAGETGRRYRIELSEDLVSWRALATLAGAPNVEHVDSANPGPGPRFYRAYELADASALTGDHLATSAGDAVLHPINHASVVVGWNNIVIHVDPVGGASPYANLPKPDLILVSHSHSDHLDSGTLSTLRKPTTLIIAPAAVYASLPAALKPLTLPLANGASTNLAAYGGLTVDAIPAYNANHPKGSGNGYVLTLGGRRIYFSGDTEDVAEMRALTQIDAAFLCMNIPFTMTVAKAASAVRAFRPRYLYPYHYRNQDGSFANLESFRNQVGTDANVEIRLRKWY